MVSHPFSVRNDARCNFGTLWLRYNSVFTDLSVYDRLVARSRRSSLYLWYAMVAVQYSVVITDPSGFDRLNACVTAFLGCRLFEDAYDHGSANYIRLCQQIMLDKAHDSAPKQPFQVPFWSMTAREAKYGDID